MSSYGTATQAEDGTGSITTTTGTQNGFIGRFEFFGHQCHMSYWRFVTSAIDDGDTVSAAVFSAYGQLTRASLTWTARLREHTSWDDPISVNDWVTPPNMSGKTLLATFAASGWVTTGYNAFTSEAAFPGVINKTGDTKMFCHSSTHESRTAPAAGQFFDVAWYPSEDSGTTRDPKLVVTHAAAGGTTYEKTGLMASEAKLSATKLADSPRSNIAISAAALSGADARTAVETALVIATAVALGADVHEAVETGSIVAASVASGKREINLGKKNIIVSEGKLMGVAEKPSADKTGKVVIGVEAPEGASGAIDTVTKNGILVDFDPPSGIDNVKEIKFDPTAQTYQVGMVVACPQGDSGAILTTPNGDMTDTVWDQNRVNDDGFFTCVKSSGDPTKFFSSNMRIGGTTGDDEPITTLPRDAAKHGYEDGDILWDEESRNYRGAWAPSTVYANQDVVIGGIWVWRAIGGGTSGSSPPTWPSSSQAGNNSVDESSAGFGGDVFWSKIGEHIGDWDANTDFFPNIYNDGSGNPVYCTRPYVSLPSTPTKILMLMASTLGTFATASAEPSWDGAANNRSMYKDGDIYWIKGKSLFGGGSSVQAEQLVITGIKAPAAPGKILKITNLGIGGMQVVLSDHATHRDFWGLTPTDVDSQSANRFKFSQKFRGDLYIRAGESRWIIYDGTLGGWTYYNTGAILSGTREVSLGKKRIVISAAVLSGHHIPENLETGQLISTLALAGSVSKTVNRQNTVVSALVALGADAATINKAGSFFSEGKLSGVQIRERHRAGMAVATIVASGADVAEHPETGTGVVGSTLSGQGTKDQSAKFGLVASGAVLSGQDAATIDKTGEVRSEAKASGTDSHESVETGSVVSAAGVSGFDSAERPKAGSPVTEASLRGQDVSEHAETGMASSAAAVSGTGGTDEAKGGLVMSEASIHGADTAEHARSGAATSEAMMTGARSVERGRTGSVISALVLSSTRSREAARTGLVSAGAVLSGSKNTLLNKAGSVISSLVLLGEKVFELFRRHGRSEADDYLRATGESEFLVGHCEADDWLRAEGESEVYIP
jgi:hypothetical protein